MIYRRRKIGLTGDFLSVVKSVSPEREKNQNKNYQHIILYLTQNDLQI